MVLSTLDIIASDLILEPDDDPALWRAVIDYVLSGWKPEVGAMLELGRCSHWLRPHQTRGTADGGFAWPAGYGEGGPSYSRHGLPEFDWHYLLMWNGERWIFPPEGYRSVNGRCPELRLAIPSRTARHQQAAIHSRWRVAGKGKFKVEFYGFRLKPEGWVCTADTSIRRPRRGRGRKPKTRREKSAKRRWVPAN